MSVKVSITSIWNRKTGPYLYNDWELNCCHDYMTMSCTAFVPSISVFPCGSHGHARCTTVPSVRQQSWNTTILRRRRDEHIFPRCDAGTEPAKSSLDETKEIDKAVSTEASDGKSERVSADALPPSLRKGEEVSMTAQAILDDVAANPEYYLNVSGVLLGLVLSIIVLSATTMALDSLPLVSDLLRMIGLVYMFWFLAKFLFSAPDRQRLANEVDEFVSGVRGGQFKVLSGSNPSSKTPMMEGDDQSLQ